MKIVICGNYGAGNLGDELILQGLLQILRELGHQEITVLSATPKETAANYQVHSLPKFPAGLRSSLKYIFSQKAQKKALEDADLFILGGGGLFSNLNNRASKIWYRQFKAAKKQKTPIFILGQSVDNPHNQIQRKIIQEVFSQADFISLRDHHSKKVLEDLHINKEIHIHPDLALHIETAEIEERKSKKALICLRKLKNYPKNFQAGLIDCLNYLQKLEWELEFIDFKSPNDASLHQEIISQLEDQRNITHHPKIEGITALKSLYTSATIVIGMRLHSVITAAKFKRPFLALNYAEKVQNFCQDLGLPEQCLELSKTEQLKEKLLWTLKNEEMIESKLAKFDKNLPEQFNDLKSKLVAAQTALR